VTHRKTEKENNDGRGGGEGEGEGGAKSYAGKKAWSSINHSTLSLAYRPFLTGSMYEFKKYVKFNHTFYSDTIFDSNHK
jgi:hypothetical protein